MTTSRRPTTSASRRSASSCSSPGSGAPRSSWPRSGPARSKHRSSTSPPSSWSGPPRRLRRRAVDEARSTVRQPARKQRGGAFMVTLTLPEVPAVMPRARLAVLTIATLLVAACAAPGAVSTPSLAASAPPSTAPSTAAGSSQAPAGSAAASGPSCGTGPVELNAYFETGFDLPFKLSDEFTKQYPNVTWKISQDQFTNLMTATPRLLSGDNPPDLIRLPSMVSLVKDGLLKNLDSYVTAYGWDKFPAA